MEKFLLDDFGKNVADERVALLNARRNLRRGADAMIGNSAEFAARFAGESHSGQAKFFCGEQTGDYVWGIAAGGDADGNVAGTGQGFDLAGENLIETVIVANGGEAGSIDGESQSGERRPVKGEAADEFGGDVLGIGGAAAIAE